NRVAACLGRSPQYQVSHTPRLVPDEVIASGVEAVVVVMPGPDDLAAVGLLRRHSLPVVVVSAAAARDAPSAPAGNGAPVLIERRPLIPYFTAVVKLPSGPPAIWLVGFANAPAALDAAIGRIQAEGLAANILVEGPAPGSAGWAGFEARIGQIAARLAATTPTIRVVPRVLASLSAGEVVVECAAGRLVVFHDDPTRGDELGDLCDLALTTERAVVFSRAAPLPRYAGQGTYFEDFSIAELMEQGVAAQIHLYNSFAEGRFFGTLDHLLSGLLPARSKAVPRESAPVPTLAAPATPGARELLALEGEAFIEAAFRLLLGRAPDPDGRRHYLAMLNRGVSRGYIAAEIRMSAEGRARGVDLSGLEAEIRRYGWLRRPVIGRLLRLAGQGRDPSRPASRPATVGPVSLAQLLAEHDEAFVRAAYQAILGRAPDSEGLAYYLRVLRDGGSPLSILARLRFSPEGRRVGVGVDGLDRALWRHRLERWPVVGVLARLGSSEHDPTQRRLRAIEARLHQVLATGHQRFDRIETMAQTLDDNVGKLETALRRLGRRPASRRPAGVSRPRTVSPRREPRLYYLLPSDDSAPSSLAMLVTQRLGQGLLDARQSVRFVVWDDAAKELRLVHREVLAAWDDPQHPLFGPQDLTVYPSRAQSAVTVDAKAVQPGDWLLVATIPSEDQLGPLGAVELVLAGRRLGCALAFLFYDAGPLRVMGHKLADQYERYMQALLLVDVVLAASPEAADEVLTFLVRHQHAAALPRIQSLPLPGQINLQDRPAQAPAQPGIDWCGYARRLAAELKTVAAAPLSGFDGVYYWVTDTSVNPHNSGVQRVVRQMARGLIRCGVRVIPVRWDPDRQSLVVPTQAHLDHLSRWGGVRPEDWSPWVPPGTSGAPRWLLVPEVVHGVLGTVRETVARQGLRCAAVFYDTIPHKMRETFSAEFSENHRYYLVDVARFDKVVSICHFCDEVLRLYCLGPRARTPSV
ncbi:MAG: hypothetical protein RLZZ501_1445, partial [Pseudomonadota bacterium]